MGIKSIKHKKGGFFGLNFNQIIKYFFCGNALASVVVLGLITIFLFREGTDFFPQNWRNLVLYRKAGLEYVDYIRQAVDDHTALNRYLQDVREREVRALLKTKSVEEANAALADFDKFSDAFDSAMDDLQSQLSDLTDTVTAIKEKVKTNGDRIVERQSLLAAGKKKEADAVPVLQIDYQKELEPVLASFPVFRQKATQLKNTLDTLTATLPTLPAPEFQPRMVKFRDLTMQYLAELPRIEQELKSWNPDKPVPWYRAVSTFFGVNWTTNSYWQDWYGLLPLLVGSMLVSFIAMVIAVPLGVFSAIYVSEIAGKKEKNLIKPYVEFISAIPSVVLGFFGVAVLGESLRQLSQSSLLAWVPGFPMTERLNAFTAGCLLALMAIPTIFSLSEDALNNVPLAFKEASYAMGANRLQTIIRILVPASISGIISAVLLGFGRVIGETMVVLLCAGNRIEIPDFTQGMGVFFQPVHTMTGIIAQEMGEVVRGDIQYRALFMIGIVLFLIALFINFMAQKIVQKYRISIG